MINSFINTGINVIDNMYEKIIDEIIEIDRSVNNSPKIPGNKKNGIKTIIVVMDELKIDFFDFIIDWYIFLSVNIFPFEFEIKEKRRLEDVKSEGPGDIGAEEKAKAIANVVKCRETTNQRLIDFYEKAYFDCITKENANRQEKIDTIKNLWFSYLDEASDVADEDGRIEIINYVQSQLSLLAIDIMDDKI